MAADGWLQATLSIGSDWQEVALITPPLMPEEQWAPAMKVLRQERMFAIRDGMLQAPESPGLGLDVDPDALRRAIACGTCRKRGFSDL